MAKYPIIIIFQTSLYFRWYTNQLIQQVFVNRKEKPLRLGNMNKMYKR